MKRITSIEIQALKGIVSNYRDENITLKMENDELRKQLEESRAKEGKGAFERMMDGIADAVAGIGKKFSSMSPNELKALMEEKDIYEEDDTNDV